MSYLLLDIGNTRAKAVWYDRGQFSSVFDFPKEQPWPATVSGVVYASVASDERVQQLKQQSAAAHLPWQQILSEATFLGLKNCYQAPQTLGVDRWLAMLGARSLCPEQELLVLDAGTAVTVDHVKADGQHQGGWIVPGLRMQHKAVTSHTAKVFSREFDQADLSFGENTDQCLKHGILAGVVGVACMALQQAPHAKLWLTGGDSLMLYSQLQQRQLPCTYDPLLVFRGLALYLENP